MPGRRVVILDEAMERIREVADRARVRINALRRDIRSRVEDITRGGILRR